MPRVARPDDPKRISRLKRLLNEKPYVEKAVTTIATDLANQFVRQEHGPGSSGLEKPEPSGRPGDSDGDPIC